MKKQYKCLKSDGSRIFESEPKYNLKCLSQDYCKNWFTERIFGSFHCAFFFLLLLLFINSYWLSNILPLALSHSSFSFFFVFFLHLCCHKTLQILQAAFIFTASLVLRMVDPSPFLFSKCSFNLHLRNIGHWKIFFLSTILKMTLKHNLSSQNSFGTYSIFINR